MSKTVEPNSTMPLTYNKEVFDQLCLLCGMDDLTKGPGRTIQIRDEGVFTEMVSETLDWTFSCDLTEPGSPDPLTAPALPFPFTANHLASFMLAGWGYLIQEAYGDWASGPDEAMLQRFSVRSGKAKEVLCGAYNAYRHAEMVVGKRDKNIEAKTQQLEVQYQEEERRASERENFRERGISEDEYRQRHSRYKASIAKPRTQMDESLRQSDQAFSSWRKAMVNQLLRLAVAAIAKEHLLAETVAEEETIELGWFLAEPESFRGYSEALYEHLKSAHNSRVPRRPRASDIVDKWTRTPIFPVTSVDDGIVSYENANGIVVKISTTRAKTLDAIRKAIGRMTSKKRTEAGR